MRPLLLGRLNDVPAARLLFDDSVAQCVTDSSKRSLAQARHSSVSTTIVARLPTNQPRTLLSHRLPYMASESFFAAATPALHVCFVYHCKFHKVPCKQHNPCACVPCVMRKRCVTTVPHASSTQCLMQAYTLHFVQTSCSETPPSMQAATQVLAPNPPHLYPPAYPG